MLLKISQYTQENKCLESLFDKVAGVFSCEYCEILKNTYFEKRLRKAASKTEEVSHPQGNGIEKS